MPQSKLIRSKALDRMTSALELLDELDAPGAIGAELDLAIARLGQDGHAPTGAQGLADRSEHEPTLAVVPGTDPNPWEIPPA